MPVALAPGTKVHLALTPVDMRKGFDGLAASVLKRDPFCGHLFLFRSRRADRLKLLWWDGSGLCLFKRLERGRLVWPRIEDGAITLTPAQLAMLVEGLDWRRAVLLEDPPRPTVV